MARKQQVFDKQVLRVSLLKPFKGSRDPSHFVFEINVGKKRIRHTTTLKLNDEILNRLLMSIGGCVRLKIQIRGRYMSDPIPSDIDFKNQTAWI